VIDFKLDPDKCAFSIDALCVDGIDKMFATLLKRRPGMKMYVYEKLDSIAGFSTTGLNPDKVVRMTRDDLHDLTNPGASYAFRTNDVVLSYGTGFMETMVISCMGQMIFEGD